MFRMRICHLNPVALFRTLVARGAAGVTCDVRKAGRKGGGGGRVTVKGGMKEIKLM